ncbi:hypothetical protein NOR_03889 [Metarhizium rileyi]|uniref:Uncharacterized protein n=1 Tax=Metarhizium rileyi (strain RCEF 4871) TaxID=1649241 RepID=A0A167EMJ3_METRR|nr:hypothetical protein NOR_03889 [Metarhizium rileyi RCEF 4871]TWU72030.1 hypothetical protein ED733_001161 [Metarhizium rileyi]
MHFLVLRALRAPAPTRYHFVRLPPFDFEIVHQRTCYEQICRPRHPASQLPEIQSPFIRRVPPPPTVANIVARAIFVRRKATMARAIAGLAEYASGAYRYSSLAMPALATARRG